MSKNILVYITCANFSEAQNIAQALLTNKLIACANLIDKIYSMYWWNEQIQQDSETIIIAKTQKALFENLINEVKKIHSYNCPCIISVPIEGGYKPYLDWIEKEYS